MRVSKAQGASIVAIVSIGLAFACLAISSQVQLATLKRGLVLAMIGLVLVGVSALLMLVAILGWRALASLREKKVALSALQIVVGIALGLVAVAVGIFGLDMLGFFLYWKS
jgi:uncharacterized membrane protein YidH (DUF202 family)